MGMRLKQLRARKGKTQAEIADILSVQQNTYSQYETGKRQIPLESLIVLAKYYRVTTDYLLELSDK